MTKATARLDRIELGFVPPRRNVPMGWPLLALGLAATMSAGVLLRSAQAERATYASALAASGGAGSPSLAGGASPMDARAARAAAGVARDLQVPWAQMLAVLESVQSRDVTLLAVEPSAVLHNVRITAEAKSADAMLNFVDALRGQSFPEATLASHQLEAQVPGKPVRFTIQARWSAP